MEILKLNHNRLIADKYGNNLSEAFENFSKPENLKK